MTRDAFTRRMRRILILAVGLPLVVHCGGRAVDSQTPAGGAAVTQDASLGGAAAGGRSGSAGEHGGTTGAAGAAASAGAAAAPGGGGGSGPLPDASGGAAGTAASGGSAPFDAATEDYGVDGASGACNCGPLEQCWNDKLCVAKLVAVTGGYQIDATEVTQGQYGAWLATNPSTSGQDPWCSWNDRFEKGCSGAGLLPCQATGGCRFPTVCVDWCDAYAYCKAVGKRLCGKIGGGPNDFLSWADATKSQWYNACSSGGVCSFPYGNTFQSGTCHDPADSLGSYDVGTHLGCQSSVDGYRAVFDLSGNVWEWEDSCSSVEADASCRYRGGSTYTHYDNPRCDDNRYTDRSSTWEYRGFRCCSG
jgi:formylglycine-generating enzyme required for sulfatase activity